VELLDVDELDSFGVLVEEESAAGVADVLLDEPLVSFERLSVR
jgi:hypothetical protein